MFQFGGSLRLCEIVLLRTSLGLAPPNLPGPFVYGSRMSDRSHRMDLRKKPRTGACGASLVPPAYGDLWQARVAHLEQA